MASNDSRTAPGLPLAFVELASNYTGPGCLEWPYAKHNGYGVVRIDGKARPAHRVVLAQAVGSPPDPAMYACHRPVLCHNRTCVNPRHLYWGSSAQNKADTLLDGTKNHGERCGAAKLTEAQVHAIRAAEGTQAAIAEWFGVSQPLVSMIRSRKIWAHLP